ncbi:MAG TPA: sugar ABC transporter ATP-binding protein [Planctomycetota bacterium]|jgi:ribose transport system ATP-binding protein
MNTSTHGDSAFNNPQSAIRNPQSSSLLAASGIKKSYSSVVLDGVDFELRRGEVHALVGENGAGKSTLCRIICGLTLADAGQMVLSGLPYAPRGKADAEHHGVRMVMQELNLIGNLSVAENIFLAELPNRIGVIDYRRLNENARGVMARVGLSDIDPSRPVNSLGVGQQQLVEIAAGLAQRCDVLILDEPTAALTGAETDLLFTQIARLKTEGAGIIYISHRMEELKRIADRITVLRDGKMIGTRETAATNIDEIVHMMVGRQIDEAFTSERRARGEVALRVENLCRADVVRNVSFEAYRGEILGFAGLMGSGRTETMRLIFGADKADDGNVYLHGSTAPARIRSPRDAVRRGIALLTEDRKAQGLLLPLPIRINVTLARMKELLRVGAWINSPEEQAVAQRWTKALSVRCHSSEQRANELSGGNQQKVVIARWLHRDCDILIFDEPTRGIDVGAKFEIYQLLHDLAARGKAVIVVSSDLKELLGLCDRIAVMSAGTIAETFERGQWTQDKIMAAALSGYTQTKALSAE